MKSLISLAVGLLFLSPVSFAAGNGQVDIRYCYGDTVWSNAAASFDIWIANDIYLAAFQIPVVLSSPDGVACEWNSQLSGWGVGKYVTHNPDSRIEPPASWFDLTAGILIREGALPDSIGIGAATMMGPAIPAGPLEHWLSIHLTPSAPTNGQTHQFCLDLTRQVDLMTFSLSDYGGLGMTVTFLDDNNDGVWCWPVVAYIPGDANGDRLMNIGDAVYIVNRIFRDGPPFNPTEAADANCDGSANVGDAVYLVNHIFRDGPAPCADVK